MKLNVCLALSVVVSVAFMGLMKFRKKEQALADKQSKFQEIKLRVTQEVLDDYKREIESTRTLLDQTKTEVTATEKEINDLKAKETQKTGEQDTCQSTKKEIGDQVGLLQTEHSNKNAEFNKEKTSWEAEATSLKQQSAQRSKVCDFVKDTAEARRLCHDMVAPKKDEVKAEAPKQEEPKAEAPKQEEPKPEAPKQEDPKAEPKAEAPKQEEPKAEAPKQEEPKAEGPKPEEPKAEAPKQEEPKAEAPKQEEPKAEAPKQEEVKAEAPKRR